MKPYASVTRTKRNLMALEAAGWGLLLSPANPRLPLGSWAFPFALDNGAWSAYTQGQPWDETRFLALVDRSAAAADFVIAPDIVAGGHRSLELSLSWLDRLRSAGARRILLAVQDGLGIFDLIPHLAPDIGIFVGGSTEWKWRTLPIWGRLCRERGIYLHVGRVNSARRIAACALVGADSIDGTSASRYASTIALLTSAVRQPSLPIEVPA